MIPDSLKKMDIYLFDQIQKGNIRQGMKVLDAGCGHGRNLFFFIEKGVEVYGLEPEMIRFEELKLYLGNTYPDYDLSKLSNSFIENNDYASNSFDFIICSAVLHFANSEKEFMEMMEALIRVLKPQGTLFIRMAGLYAVEALVIPTETEKHFLPDETERFLLTDALIDKVREKWKVSLSEGLKSVHVHGLRSMTNWVLTKD